MTDREKEKIGVTTTDINIENRTLEVAGQVPSVFDLPEVGVRDGAESEDEDSPFIPRAVATGSDSVKYVLEVMNQDSSKESQVSYRCGIPSESHFSGLEIRCISPDDDPLHVTFQHILAFKLEDDHTLKSVLEHKRTDYLLGFILVNYEEQINLPDGFWDVGCPKDHSFCILKKTDGEALLSDLLKTDTPGAIQVKVIKETCIDQPGKIANQLSSEEVQVPEVKRWPWQPKKFGYSLYKQLQSYFSSSKENPEEGLFAHIVSHFHNFETNVSKTDLAKGLKLMKERVNHPNFCNEALLHLVIVYRVIRNEEVYKKDHADGYIKCFISRFEELSKVGAFSSHIKSFIKCDFDITGADHKATTAFTEISQSALRLCKSSMAVKANVGRRLIWIYIHIIFGKEKFSTEQFHDLWERILNSGEGYYFDETRFRSEDLQDMQIAVHFGHHLDIPNTLQISGTQLALFLTAKGKYCHLSFLREIVNTFKGSIFKVHRNLYDFLVTCFPMIETHLSPYPTNEKLLHLCASGDLESVLEEGVEFITAIADCYEDPAPDLKLVFRSFSLFWKKLLSLVVKHHAEKTAEALFQISLVLKGPTSSLKTIIKIELNRQFVELFEEHLASYNMGEFLVYYQRVANLITPELVRKYLDMLVSKASKNTWIEIGSSSNFTILLSEFYRNFPKCDSRYHKCFIEVIKSFCENSQQKTSVIQDLLQMSDQHLLSMIYIKKQETMGMKELQQDFRSFLKTFLSKNRIIDTAYKGFLTFFEDNIIAVNLTPMQTEVLSTCVELYCANRTSKDDTQSLKDECTKFAVTRLVEAFNKDCKIQSSPASVPLKWYWEILECSCHLFNPHQFDPSWFTDIGSIIRLLSVYGAFIDCFKVKVSQEKMPVYVAKSGSDHMIKYFKWVVDLEKYVRGWQNKILENDYTHQEILDYAIQQIPIEKVAENLKIESHLTLENITERKEQIIKYKEATKSKLIREDNTCRFSVMAVFKKYDFHIPTKLHTLLQEFIIDCNKRLFASHVYSPQDEKDEMFFNVKLKMASLNELHGGVVKLLTPLEDYLKFITKFVNAKSQFFDHYFKKSMTECTPSRPCRPTRVAISLSLSSANDNFSDADDVPDSDALSGVPAEVYLEALKNTDAFFKNILNENATYESLQFLGVFQNNVDEQVISNELKTICEFYEFTSSDDIGGIKSIIRLIQFAGYIKDIHEVCDQYKLKGCLTDPKMGKLLAVRSMVSKETIEELTAARSKKMLDEVYGILSLAEEHHNSLKLFPLIRESADFYQLLQEKNFGGKKGTQIFQQQHTLITQHLQHEEYNEQVLNHLMIAFRYISPFLDTEQNLKQLMEKVYHVTVQQTGKESATEFIQLHTVNRNMDLVRLWFSKAEWDTLENIGDVLRGLLDTGYFKFSFEDQVVSTVAKLSPYSHKGRQQSKLVLCYTPSSSQGEGGTKVRTWQKEQIEDFTRKLGFLEKGQNSEDYSKFQRLSVIAHSLFAIQQKLLSLGYKKVMSSELKCSCSLQEAEKQHSGLEERLKNWQNDLLQLQENYDKLLLFRIPKILRIHRILLLPEDDIKIKEILQEVAFLFPSLSSPREKIAAALQNYFSSTIQSEVCSASKETKMTITNVGEMLKFLFKEIKFTFTSHALRGVLSQLPFLSVPDRFKSENYVCNFHIALSFTSKDLIRLILEIYRGIPGPYELFHCRPDTTSDELSLFYRRAMKFFSLQFTILEVNLLPAWLQDELLQLHLTLQKKKKTSTLHYIATGPTVLQDMPWVTMKEHISDQLIYDWDTAKVECNKLLNPNSAAFAVVELVYGKTGDGKTHYIRKRLNNHKQSLTVVINESFSAYNTVVQLRQLPLERDNAIYFSFTMLPPSEEFTELDKNLYKNVMKKVERFFFDLIFLGYVEDSESGVSFKLPGDLQWSLYFEVSSRENLGPQDSLNEFTKELPVVELIGKRKYIKPENPYDVNSDVQLVCKYLQAYDMYRNKESEGINRILPPMGRIQHFDKIAFSHIKDLPKEECQRLLYTYMPEHIKQNKIYQKLFVGYMTRRCCFMETFPAFNYNEGRITYDDTRDETVVTVDTSKLGSTVMETMLKEVSDFCQPRRMKDWTKTTKQQLVYDEKDGGGSFHLIAVNSEKMQDTEKEKYRIMRVEMPPSYELKSRDYLDKCLSSALNVPLKNGRISAIDERKYVLTLDYTLKMLEIHERFQCGIPVVIEGETGVGKTALLEMLSVLWNQSLLSEQRLIVDRVLILLQQVCSGLKGTIKDETFSKVVQCINNKESVPYIHLKHVCSSELEINDPKESKKGSLKQEPKRIKLSNYLACYVSETISQPVINLLDYKAIWSAIQSKKSQGSTKELPELPFEELVKKFEKGRQRKYTAGLLYYLLRAEPLKTFYKLNVHAALTTKDIYEFFEPIFNEAKLIEGKCQKYPSFAIPRITIFLDEINTSSCLGLLKEVLVDQTFYGKKIPGHIFIVSACNPHRGNSVFVHEKEMKSEAWVRGSYNVHRLHPTIKCLKWDYGFLNIQQEDDYIKAKMRMLSGSCSITLTDHLSAIIGKSQKLMRDYATEHLTQVYKVSEDVSKKLSYSCVSQRDIQRVFTFYEWLRKGYLKFGKERFNTLEITKSSCDEQAVLVALGLVYYLRLDEKYRDRYNKDINKAIINPKSVVEALKEEMDFYSDHLSIPRGIAKTQALMENLFCTIVCCCTCTPLIIVGAPGSSKTLSFNLVLSNLKGRESKSKHFRDTSLFPSLDPHFYQCSRRTTSVEVETVFQIAVKRQSSFNEYHIPIKCVVFMDEAGLPEESHESLKVLHRYLDTCEVAFVAITNHLLDAAKTNRAVSLFRASYSFNDMKILAKECLGSLKESDTSSVQKLCQPYQEMSNRESFKTFFGLRDFIHLIHYLRRNGSSTIDTQLVIKGLERNLNGNDEFELICNRFLKVYKKNDTKNIERRSIIRILEDSLADKPNRTATGEQEAFDEVRYKLIVDPSEDDSLSRLLLMYKILDPKRTRIFMCSDFPEDNQLQKVNTIAAIRHAAVEGHTVLMTQTDDIHESFYDLFNQHFRRIDDPDRTKEPRFYANIAIGAHHKPCRVHKDFQCVVVVKKSEIPNTPAPFLNRFEKYCISHKDFFNVRLQSLQPCMSIVVKSAFDKVLEFFKFLEEPNFYGARVGETVESLALSVLPAPDFTFKEIEHASSTDVQPDGLRVGPTELLVILMETLQNSAGFQFKRPSNEELKSDANYMLDHFASLTGDFQGYAQAVINKQYSSNEIEGYVKEAINHLHLAPHPKDAKTDSGYVLVKGVSNEACLIVMVTVQLLIMYMRKRLLQLVTAEALTLARRKLPHWFMDSYLSHQNHFSLKDLIDSTLRASEDSKKLGTVPTKLICFTRSTSAIHHLPALYGSHAVNCITDNHSEFIKDVVHEDVNQVYLCKLSGVQSETAFKNHLQMFSEQEEKKIMILIISMQETSKQMVNHIRIIIDQKIEEKSRSRNKLFVLLLHFPPSMFYNACYPVLFLYGWDHHYLDSIQPEPEGIVDIRTWFRIACQRSKLDDGQSFIMEAIKSMIPDSISVVASRVNIGSRNGGGFNSIPQNGTERVSRFKRLLEGEMGQKLCKMYATYWQPAGMARNLEETAQYAKNHKSTISITDSVKDFFKTAFHNFLAYMTYHTNQHLNLDVIYDCQDAPTKNLFLQLLELVPIPKLLELKAYNNTWAIQQTLHSKPSFPFFYKICEILDEMMEACIEDIQKGNVPAVRPLKETVNTGPQPVDSYKRVLSTAFLQQLSKNIEDGANREVCAVLQALTDHRTLWDKYWKDFISTKFHFPLDDTFTIELVTFTFTRHLNKYSLQQKLVVLHCNVHIDQIHLAKLISTLRPLQQLESQLHPEAQASIELSPVDRLKEMVEMKSCTLDDATVLCQFIVDRLFLSFTTGCLKHESTLQYAGNKQLIIWYQAYRNATQQSSALFQTSNMESGYRAKQNVLHAIFLVLQMRPEIDEDLSQVALTLGETLLKKYFTETFDIKGACLNLCEITTTLCEVIPPNFPKEDISNYLENLLNFFFFPGSTRFTENDMKWFFNKVNEQRSMSQISNLTQDLPVEESRMPLFNTMFTPAMSRHFLCRILTQKVGNEKPVNPLSVFYRLPRKHVANIILRRERSDDLSIYMPKVYSEIPAIDVKKNEVMMQPLADLYFVVVLEHLKDKKGSGMTLEGALHTIKTVQDHLNNKRNDNHEKLLCLIELQAVVQVALEKIAETLAKRQFRHTAMELSPGICTIVSDTFIGGGENSGHERIVLMHLLRELKGPTRLLEFLNIPNMTTSLDFLDVYKDKLKSTAIEKVHLMPFVTQREGQLTEIYITLSRLITACCDSSEDQKTNENNLIKNIQKILKSHKELTYDDVLVDTKQYLKMAIWLVVYYELYCKKICCPSLAILLETQLSELDFTKEQLHILTSFLVPNEMQKHLESPFPTDEISSIARKAIPESELFDPIYDLFYPKDEIEDSSDIELRHALANLVGVAFSVPKGSSHLWNFLFDQSKLEDTYLPGFMWSSKISAQQMFFDSGILLNEEGNYEDPDYRTHKSGLSLHSFYLMNWTSVGALCISLLTNPEAQDNIHNHIISDWQPLRHFCFHYLKSIWSFMSVNLQFTEEERSFFIVRSMDTLFKFCQTNNLKGTFYSREDVLEYETFWHSEIYEPSKLGLSNILRQQYKFTRHPLFNELKVMSTLYPSFPSEKDFYHNLVSLSEGRTTPGSTPFSPILAQFVEDRHRLAVGSALLPDLVEFYLWLDQRLAHLLSYETAPKLTIKEIILKAANRFQYEAESVKTLFNRMKDSLNEFIHLSGNVIGTGGCLRHRQEEKITKITDDTPVMRLLSTEDTHEGNDWLCIVMQNIVNLHNHLVSMVEHQGFRKKYRCWLPETLPEIDVKAFSPSHAIYLKDTDDFSMSHLFVTIMRSRYQAYSSLAGPTTIPFNVEQTLQFDMEKLEGDVVRYFIAGKPHLKSVKETIRRPFRFRNLELSSQTPGTGLAGPGCPIDLAALSQELPSEFKVPLSEDERKEFEADFHNADYKKLSELVSGLRTAAGYLSQDIQTRADLQDLTLSQFLRDYFAETNQTPKELLSSIELENFSVEEFNTIERIKMKQLFKILEMFVRCITDCLFDFCELPFSVKKPLPEGVAASVEEKVQYQTTKDLPDILAKVVELEKTVSIAAQGLRTENIVLTTPLIDHLTIRKLNKEEYLVLLPRKVLVQHYVQYIVFLRKWKFNLQERSNSKAGDLESLKRNVSIECVPDIWERLPHFQNHVGKSPECLDTSTMKNNFQAAEKDILSFDHDESDQIWVESTLDQPSSPLPADKSCWSSVDLGVWLHSINMGKYAKAFQEKHIDGKKLVDMLEDQDLDELDISSDVEKTKLKVRFLGTLQECTLSIDQVFEWMNTRGFENYSQCFKEADVDGALLTELLNNLGYLKELGMKLREDRKRLKDMFIEDMHIT